MRRSSQRRISAGLLLLAAGLGRANLIEHPDLFYAVASFSPTTRPRRPPGALTAEFDWLRTEPVSARELGRAKNQLGASLDPAELGRRGRNPRDGDLYEACAFSATGFRPIAESNEAYKPGVNYIMYGVTH